MFQGKCVLITGAGGSIGSELARQTLGNGARKVVLLERSEHGLYRLSQELGDRVEAVYAIGDVLDARRLRHLFSEHRPNVVLHAAAFKHVPILEDQISEAVRNNVVGTFRVASAAVAHGSDSFILVSTDKAVRPTSIMGATKRMAELVVQAIGRDAAGGIRASTVRFGNVRDSVGSVLPLFREQIAAGGPVTVTHAEATRYFMSVEQAACLVLEASRLGNGGEIFLLEMGEPVRIRDLALELIEQSKNREIRIVFTGLRRGEKVHEELCATGERIERSVDPRILVCRSEGPAVALPSNWREQLDALERADPTPPDEELKAWIRSWVPDYQG